MREEAALQVLLVEAFEEADPEGRILALDERAQASLTGRRAGGGDAGATVAARAEILARLLLERVGSLGPALRVVALPSRLAPALCLGAGALGLGSNALGPERHVNLLSVPLLGLFAWNAGVYVALALAALARRRAPASGRGGRGWADLLAGLAARARRPRADADAGIVRSAVVRYAAAWRHAAGRLWAARVRVALQMAAIAFSVGLLAGMYARGVAFEYRATWESTFLGAREVHAVLRLILGPAAALLGRTVPGPEALAGIAAPGSGEAAPWIHLYAVTAALLVVAPRTALAAIEAGRARRLAADVPVDLDQPYFRRLLAAERGAATSVEVVPYGHRPEPECAAALAGLLREIAGYRSRVRVHDAAPYGTEADELLGRVDRPASEPTGTERWLAMLFNLAQSPEPEVHGALVERLREWAASPGAPTRLLVIVDGSAYRQALAASGAAAARLDERRRAWDRVAGPAVVHVDLAVAGADSGAAALEGSLRSAPGAAGRGAP